MKRKLLLMIGSITLILVTLLGWQLIKTRAYRDQIGDTDVVRVSETQLSSQPEEALTLLEAWNVVMKYASDFEDNPKIAILSSVDSSFDVQLSPGLDGRRRSWLAVLTSPKSDQWVTISDGIITEVIERPPTGNTAFGDAPSLDSPEALSVVQELRADLSPAVGEGWGYHFIVMIDKDSSRPVFRVIGSFNTKPAFVDLNPVKGTLLQAKRLSHSDGGILYSQDAGSTWEPSNLTSMAVVALVADPWQEDRAYAVASVDWQIWLFTTKDGGKNWQKMGMLPATAGDWPWCIAVGGSNEATRKLLVGVRTGLWESVDGQSWEIIPGLPGGAAQISTIRTGEKYKVFVSVTQGDQKGLYTSTDLSAWEKISDTPYRLSESYDNKHVIATSNVPSENSLLFDVDEKSVIELPIGTLRVAGDFDSTFVFYGDQSGQVGRVSSDNYQNVERSLTANIGSLVASPDYSSSQLLLAGAFRGGIYQSRDGGRTWQEVLADPNQVVAGNNEISIKFLSSQKVVALNGGHLTWLDY